MQLVPLIVHLAVRTPVKQIGLDAFPVKLRKPSLADVVAAAVVVAVAAVVVVVVAAAAAGESERFAAAALSRTAAGADRRQLFRLACCSRSRSAVAGLRQRNLS